jgi:hypothetical protein
LSKFQAALSAGSAATSSTFGLAKLALLVVGVGGIVGGALVYSQSDKTESRPMTSSDQVVATAPRGTIEGAETAESKSSTEPAESSETKMPAESGESNEGGESDESDEGDESDESDEADEADEGDEGGETTTPDAEAKSTRQAHSSTSSARVDQARGLHRDEHAAPIDPDALLRLEIAHLAQTRQALGDAPGKALELARDGQKKFSAGMFGEERQAIIVIALSKIGRTLEAKRRGKSFLGKHPKGPFSARVRGILEGTDNAP